MLKERPFWSKVSLFWTFRLADVEGDNEGVVVALVFDSWTGSVSFERTSNEGCVPKFAHPQSNPFTAYVLQTWWARKRAPVARYSNQARGVGRVRFSRVYCRVVLGLVSNLLRPVVSRFPPPATKKLSAGACKVVRTPDAVNPLKAWG